MPKTRTLKPAAAWQEIEPSEKDWDNLGKSEALRMYHHLRLVRAFEEQVLELDAQGLIHGPAHSSIGQEGGAIGSISPMRPGDQVSGSHRGHHQFLAKGLNYLDADGYDPLAEATPQVIEELVLKSLAEIMGLAPGFCKGRGGSMHLRWSEAGALGTNAIVGGGVPFATGAAWSKKRDGSGDVVFTYFGEGGAHIGSVHESLNLAALWNLPICFFVENNGFAVSTTLAEQTRETRISSRGVAYGIPSFRVDGMNPLAVRLATERAMEIMRSGGGPVLIEAMLYRFYHHGGGLPASAFGYRSKDEETEWRNRDPLLVMSGELKARGWLDNAVDAELAVITQDLMNRITNELTDRQDNQRQIKPSLWPDTATRDEGLRGNLSELDGRPHIEQEDFEGELAPIRFVDAVSKVMNRRMEMEEDIFCMGEDIHRLKGGTNGATKGLSERFPDRVIPTPIAEAGFCGLAGGVASLGRYRPVVELMYPDFSLVAADQLFNQIGKARHMFGGDTDMPLVLRTKIAIGTGYGSQHSMDPAGLFVNWPGWRIVAPSTPYDYVGLMNSALVCRDPVLVIEHVDLYSEKGLCPVENYDFFLPLGKAKIRRPGSDLTILTYSSMVQETQRAVQNTGIDAEIIDLRSLDRAGLDWETIGTSLRKTNTVLIVEQGSLTCSYGAILADEIHKRFFDFLDHPVERIVGGEASPSVSKVLERSTYVCAEDIELGLRQVMTNVSHPRFVA
tara:strand:+ start:6273 stop:8465 length:2193 start_codon:yes stop_codon:yes gene_type:complete